MTSNARIAAIVDILAILGVTLSILQISQQLIAGYFGLPFFVWFFLDPLLVIGFAILLLKGRGEGLAAVGWNGFKLNQKALTAIIASIILWAILFIFIRPWLAGMGLDAGLDMYGPIAGQLDHFIFWFIRAWIGLAIAEELIFRGIIQQRLTTIFGTGSNAAYIALLGQAILFGLFAMFQLPIGFVMATLTGLVFGGCQLFSGNNLFATILARGIAYTVLLATIYLELGVFS